MVLGNNFPYLDYLLSPAKLQEKPFFKSGAKHFLDHKLLDGSSEEKKKSIYMSLTFELSHETKDIPAMYPSGNILFSSACLCSPALTRVTRASLCAKD